MAYLKHTVWGWIYLFFTHFLHCNHRNSTFAVNPLDVVKIRLQAQHMPVKTSPVFVYHRGIVEELCVCRYCTSAGVTADASISPALRPFNGTLVSPQTSRNDSFPPSSYLSSTFRVVNLPGNKSISQGSGKYREILGNTGKYWEIPGNTGK